MLHHQKQKRKSKLDSFCSFIKDYCDSVKLTVEEYFADHTSDTLLFKQIEFIEENLSEQDYINLDIVIIGVPEDKNSTNKGTSLAPNLIRKYLYSLSNISDELKIADIGNLKISNNINDTYFGLRDLISELLEKDIVVIIIGGSQDLTYGNFLAYTEIEEEVNIVSIDSKFDIALDDETINSENFISKIVSEKAKYLYNYTNIGYQKYLVSQEDVLLMKEMFFDSFRLGEIRKDLKETEAILRDANLVSFDIGAIKQADAPARINPSPNGFFSNEACQISKYAGLCDNISSFGLYEVNPEYDNNYQTTNLAAQIIWHFIEGYTQRIKEYLTESNENFIKYIINLNDFDHQIVFYKSKITERWWMQIPEPGNVNSANEKGKIIACSYNDYKIACKNEIPDRMWKFIQKHS